MLKEGKVKIAVATVIKTHGIKGELNIEVTDYAEIDEDFAPGACLIVEIDGLDVPFFVASSRTRGGHSLLLSLDEVDSEQQAAELSGHKLFVYADPEESDELTAGELMGYDIIDADSNQTIGRVEELEELTPGAWYFRLAESGKLIPAVDEMIENVNSGARVIIMRLPDGLLEL